MARCRFVTPDVVRVSLSDGDWLDLKKTLNTGEQREMLARTYQSVPGVDGLKVDIRQVGLARVVAYVVGWSFVDGDGRPVTYTESALSSLEPESFAEILTAVDTHIAAQEAIREAQKNAPAGESTSRPTSLSAA